MGVRYVCARTAHLLLDESSSPMFPAFTLSFLIIFRSEEALHFFQKQIALFFFFSFALAAPQMQM